MSKFPLMRHDNRHGYDEPVPGLEIKEVPASIVVLRTELAKPENKDILDAAIKEASFEACLGTIALHLDIALDGMYEVSSVCDVLAEALVNRHLAGSKNQPHLRSSRLVAVELVEREKEVTLEVAPEVPTIAATSSEDATTAKCSSSQLEKSETTHSEQEQENPEEISKLE